MTINQNFMKRFIFFWAIMILLSASSCYAQNPDIDLLKTINLNRDTVLDSFFNIITNLAYPIAVILPLILLLIRQVKTNFLSKYQFIYLASSLLSAFALSEVLKYLVNRPRPYVTYAIIQNVTSVGSPSFPSGHTTISFALATALFMLFRKWYIAIIGYLWALVVLYSRMDLGMHYPSDVLAGVILGSGTAYFCYLIFNKYNSLR